MVKFYLNKIIIYILKFFFNFILSFLVLSRLDDIVFFERKSQNDFLNMKNYSKKSKIIGINFLVFNLQLRFYYL